MSSTAGPCALLPAGGEPGPTTVPLSSSVCPEGPVPGPGSKEVQAPIAGPCGRTVQAPATLRPRPSQARPLRSADAPPRALGPAPGLGKQACPGREEPITARGLFSSSLAVSHFKTKIINTDTQRLERERELKRPRRSQGARTCAARAALTRQPGQGASEPGGCKQTGARAGGARPGQGRSPRAGLVPGSWWHQGPRGRGGEQGTRLVTLSSVAPAPAKRPPCGFQALSSPGWSRVFDQDLP